MLRKNGGIQERSKISARLGWKWLSRCCLAVFILLFGACGKFPSDTLELAPVEGGTCNPILQLQNNTLYQVKDIKTGTTTQPYADLFKKGEEWGCLVSMWTDRQTANEANKSYVSMVKLTPDGKLSSLEPIDGKTTPVLRIPTGDKQQGFHFVLYMMKSAVVVPTQQMDLGKIQGASDSERAGLTVEERKVRIGLDTLKEMCRVADSPQYSCFGKNRGDCLFYFKLYPTAPKLPDVNKTLAQDTENRGCVLCSPELCNNKDDDCDGMIDNMRDPVTGESLKDAQDKPLPLSQDCYDGNGQDLLNIEKSKGVCKVGKKTCVAGTWSKCEGQRLPEKEICNGIDDDCDGRNDETDQGPLCPGGQACENGQCSTKCPTGQTECKIGDQKLCFDLNNTREHCGRCGVACKQSEVCVAGKCALECPPEQKKCGNKCINLLSDPLNCGACGNPCKNSEVCVAGNCSLVCPAGLTRCGNFCIDKEKDPFNCGGCGTTCNPGQVCVNGACSLVCPTGLTKCTSLCVDLKSDAKHCSQCDKPCGPSEVCNGGKCSLVCPPGLKKCGTECIDTNKDVAHCSDCNKPCKQGEVCVTGKCSIVCQSGQTKCGSDCVKLASDILNCGQCGNACSNGEKCVAGKCSLECPGGQNKCGNSCCSPGQICCKGDVCADPQSSQTYCGCNANNAGENCTANNKLCKSGSCVVICPAGQQECNGICCAPGQTCCQGNVCADPKTDAKYCGCSSSNSGTDCAASGQTCSNGSCSTVCSGTDVKCGNSCCPASKVCCQGNVCVDPKTDNTYCGCTTSSSGTNCPSGQSCVSGSCSQCPAGQTKCGNQCVDTQNDSNHCGQCNNTCPGAAACKQGKCDVAVLFADSKLLNAAQMLQINTWLGTPTQAWTLCYRLSKDGNLTSTFHTNCAGKGPTVVVASMSTGKLIGGYASVSWQSTGTGYFGDGDSFLFSLTNNFKHSYYRYKSYLYRADNTRGPVWGAGIDWMTGVNQIGAGMYGNLGASYQCRVGSPASSQCREDFFGVGATLTDMEVFIKK